MKVQTLLIINIIILIICLLLIFGFNINTQGVISKIILGLFTLGIVFLNGYIYYTYDKKEYHKSGSKFLLISINNNIFKSDEDFKKYIYDNYCQCINQCIDMELYKKEEEIKNPMYCSKIKEDDKIINYKKYDKIINNGISYFIYNKKLKRSGTKFYIYNGNIYLKLTWENIKSQLNIDDQKMYWLFRKLIVDSLLKRIITKNFINKDGCEIYSVGSTKITSDYDITLYGSDKDKVLIINEFQSLFKRFFSEESSVVFDTNVYGKSYIYYSTDYMNGNTIINHNNSFYYLKAYYDEKYKTINLNSQLIWGIIKFLNDFTKSFDDKTFKNYLDYLKENLDYRLLDRAEEILLFLTNQDTEIINYNNLMLKSKELENTYYVNYLSGKKIDNANDVEIIKEHDITALINFYGTETYYTRGAFLDTVVNQQMLSGKNKIQLSDIEYITSIFENAGFFLIHNNKSKYIMRVRRTLNDLIKDYPLYNKLSYDLQKLNIIIQQFENGNDSETNYCKWISKDDITINIFKCQKYDFFNIIFNLVFNILLIAKQQYNINEYDIPFYKLFVLQKNNIFQLVESTRSKSIIKKIEDIKLQFVNIL